MEKPELVTDSEGHAVLKDGMPLYKYADGTEQPLNLAETVEGYENRINNLTDEKDRHFEAKTSVEKKLEAFGKITPDVATENARTIEKINANELIDKHGLESYEKQYKEQVVTSLTEEFDVKQNAWMEEKKRLETELADSDYIIRDLSVNNKLAAHPYFAGDDRKTVYRPQDAAKIYGDRFKVDRAGRKVKVVALDRDGKVLLSKKNHGAPAEFEEAVELIVQSDNDGSYDIFRGTKTGGPRITGNMDLGPGNLPQDGAKGTDLIRHGLKKHQQNRGY